MSNFLVYRALFPPHYSPRTQGEPNNINVTRQWHALKLPYIRVMGPLWSFGLKVQEFKDVKTLPGMDTQSTATVGRSLRALFQLQESVSLAALDKLHVPVLMRAEFDAFLQPTSAQLSESRMSLLALDTIDPAHYLGDDLKVVSAEDLPVINNARPVGLQGSIIVSPFGNPPPILIENSNGDTGQFLPAMQLMDGMIRFKPDPAYLEKARRELGIGRPQESMQDSDTIVLLPDGFCVAGTVALPWLGKEEKPGWFKATFRRFGDNGKPQRVLKLWFQQGDADHAALLVQWRGYLGGLERMLRESQVKTNQPRWLQVSPSAALEPAHLFWPESGQNTDSPLFSRKGTDRIISVDSAGMVIRLSDRPIDEQRLSNLTIQPEQFDIRRDDAKATVTINAVAGDESKVALHSLCAHYRFKLETKINEIAKFSERLSFKVDENETPTIRLAVRLIDTAEAIRQASGLPRPAMTDTLGLLWTFAPTRNGWLHWPLPNATQATLSRLLKNTQAPKPSDESAQAPHDIHGVLTFGNRPARPGFDKSARSWAFSVSDVNYAALSITFDAPTDIYAKNYGSIVEASVELASVALSFDGFAVVTPFRQTQYRLLPDHAERALGSIALEAVSPESLRGIEADMWCKETAPRVRMEVSLREFAIEGTSEYVMRIDPLASVKWTTTMTGMAPGQPAWSSTMQPWIWRAHASLPTVQALPLAAAGRARNLPMGNRALTPLFLSAPPANGQLVYSCPLDMGKLSLDITIDYPSGGNPVTGKLSFTRPNANAQWCDEIGMAVTTLPSMSLFAGTSPRLADIARNGGWDGLATPVYAQLRHDIALRDEHHAFARVPGPAAAPSSTTPLSEPVFSPLPNNGPVGVKATSNGWDRVWQFLNRKVALAALDRRAMLARDGAKLPYRLTGVFGWTDYPITGEVEVVEQTTLTTAGNEDYDQILGQEVRAIGSFTLNFADTLGAPPQAVFRGLPAESDLTGISGMFKRDGKEIMVRYGTAAIERDGGAGFTDQFGLRVQSTDANAMVTIKALVARLPDLPVAQELRVRLTTLNEPITIAGLPPFQFHCTDVPVADGGTNILEWFTAGADLVRRANSAGLDYNHLAGFRWSLNCLGLGDEFVIVQGLVFEPLELTNFTLTADALPGLVEIRGRLRLPVGSRALKAVTLPPSEGVATLTLTREGSKYEATITAKDLVFPLAPPESFAGMAPTLEFATLAAVDVEGPATLRYRFGDEEVAVSITAKRDASGNITATLAAMTLPDPAPSAIDFVKLELALAGVGAIKNHRSIEPSVDHRVQITYGLQVGPEGARIIGSCNYDLLSAAMSCPELAYAFSDSEKLGLIITQSGSAAGLTFRPGAFMLCWQIAPETEAHVLGGLGVTYARGSIMATLARKTPQPHAVQSVDSYSVVNLVVRALFQLETFALPASGIQVSKLTMALDRDGDTLRYSLSGSLLVENAFSWPQLDIADQQEWQVASVAPEAGQRFMHSATLSFDGQRIALEGLAGKRDIVVAVEVENKISLSEPGADRSAIRTITWSAFQLVRLLPIARLREVLIAVSPPAHGAQLKKDDTGYSPLVDDSAQPLIKYRAASHILQAGAANPGALSGALAAKLKQYLDANPNARDALAIDFSNHVLLAFDKASEGVAKLAAPLVLTSLPAIAFVGARSQTSVLPDDKNDAIRRAFASRPQQSKKLYLATADRYAAHLFPPLDTRLTDYATRRINDAQARRHSRSADLATAVTRDTLDQDWHDIAVHQPVFQMIVFREVQNAKAMLVAEDLPAVGAAFLLSEMFRKVDDDAPLAIGFGGFGRLAADDFFADGAAKCDLPLKDGTVFDTAVYGRSIRRFRDWAARNVVPGPGVLKLMPGKDAAMIWTVQVDAISRDGRMIETIGLLQVEDWESGRWQDAQDWARRTLQRSAPWATDGLLTFRVDGFGLDAGAMTMLVSTLMFEQVRPKRSARQYNRAPPRQPQFESGSRIELPAAGVTAGYVPLRVAPALFQSDGAPVRPGSTDGPRLTATGVTMTWRLDIGLGAIIEAGTGAAPTGSDVNEFWITDREGIAFRPSRKVKEAGLPFELTFALPDGYRAALPRALTPAAAAIQVRPERRANEYEQAFAPALVSTSRISARSGAWTSTRTGLAQMYRGAGSDEFAGVRASETPLHVRQPRPPLLALNDRTRASSHESGHASIGMQQTFVVHGPRAVRPGGDLERTGLNRAPRSLWATKLALTLPRGSIIPVDWDGTVTVSVIELFGADLANPPGWNIDSAVLTVAGDRYVAATSPSKISHDPLKGEQLRFENFALQRGDTVVQARSALRALPAATEVDFDLTLAYELNADSANSVQLNRKVRFRLLTGGIGWSEIETPLFFRFDDPEFNDRLGGLAKLARTASRIKPAENFVFAADVSQSRPDQRIELALALRSASSDIPVGLPLKVEKRTIDSGQQNVLCYNGAPVRLIIERLRKGYEGAAVRLEPKDLAAQPVTSAIADGNSGYVLDGTTYVHETLFHAMTLDCALLACPTDTGPRSALQSGDQLKLALFACESSASTDQLIPLVLLLLDVVDEPILPANPSAFAVLVMANALTKSPSPTVGVHLYANGPDATVIELVDPRDLIDGVVRRRAAYLWRSFHPFTKDDTQHFALQKINAVGASWLPRQLNGGWIALEGDTNPSTKP